MKKSFNIQELLHCKSWNQADAPLLLESFQRDQEQRSEASWFGGSKKYKQNKQTTLLHRERWSIEFQVEFGTLMIDLGILIKFGRKTFHWQPKFLRNYALQQIKQVIIHCSTEWIQLKSIARAWGKVGRKTLLCQSKSIWNFALWQIR